MCRGRWAVTVSLEQRGSGALKPARGFISSETGRVLILALYASAALLFTVAYFLLTRPWSPSDFREFIDFGCDWPLYARIFKFRVLMPVLGQALSHGFGFDPQWVFRGIAWASAFLLLLFYRRYLENFLTRPFAVVASFSIIYPLIWNCCLLNSIYYPFDIPAVLFFVMGCNFMCRRNWPAYYLTLGFALLNRDTSLFLIFVFAFTGYGSIPPRKLARHLIVQAAMWWGLKGLMFAITPGGAIMFTKSYLAFNLGTLRDMLAMEGDFLKDWIKLLLAFGGSLLVLPWILGRQPTYVIRSLLVIIPFVGVVLFRGVMDEVRVYGELIPVVFTPLVYFVALHHGGVKSVRCSDCESRGQATEPTTWGSIKSMFR